MTAHPKEHRKFWIADKATEHQWKLGAELGVQEGVTLKHVIKQNPQLIMCGIDLWATSLTQLSVNKTWGPKTGIMHKTLKKWVKENNLRDRIYLFKLSTVLASYMFKDEQLDFVFIDADHEYDGVNKDIAHYKPKVKKGGYIIGHDINKKDVRKAVEEHFGNNYEKGPDLIWYHVKG